MDVVYNKFNRGEVSDDSVARDDVKQINNSASLMRNFFPKRLGPMAYRQGTQFVEELPSAERLVPFVKKIDDTAILIFGNNDLRVVVDDAIITRTTVASAISNPDFTSNLTGWTNDDGAGSASVHLLDGGNGFAGMTGADSTSAVLYQTVTTTAVPHGLRITIAEAPCRVRIGTSGVYSSDVLDAVLDPGDHSFLFTPASNPTITLSNSDTIRTLVDSVDFETTGEMVIPTTIATADLDKIRFHQSADVMFIAVEGQDQVKVERRGTNSWAVTEYRANDGPFNGINLSDTSLTASALSGNPTLTASNDYFKSTDVGTLFKLSSAGQTVSAAVSAEDNGTSSIRVTGVSGSRIFTINISNTFSATVTLQRSADDSNWEDVTTYTTTTSVSYDDTFDNATLYYRLHVKTGDYTSGTADLELVYAAGSIDGICRVTGYTSSTVVTVQVLQAFGALVATRDWYKGIWNATQGFPSSVAIFEGRVFWAGNNRIDGSVSDAYYSFDDEVTGASAPIQRTIGIGPVDVINWLCPTSRLIIGLPTEDLSLRSSSFGEVLTNLNANIKDNSGQGSAPTDFAKAGQSVYFAHHVTTSLVRIAYDPQTDAHGAEDMMMLHPDIASAGIKRIAVVRKPETRVFLVLEDGTALVYLHDVAEQVGAWARMTCAALIEDVIVLPGTSEDRVYFAMNHSGLIALEKLSLFSETRPHDSHVRYTSPGTTLTGLTHLNGVSIGVWADGADIGDYTVSGGSVTIAAGYTDVTAGRRYTADYTSNKLTGYTTYSMIGRRARVVDIALVVSDLYGAGLSVGPDSSNLQAIEGASGTDYDQDSFPFDGSYTTDSRVHVQATAPCKIKALVYGIRESKHKATAADRP